MKVRATATATGRTQWIPEHWLEHPVLGEGFERAEKPPPPPEGTPDDGWTIAQLRGYADQQGIDLAGVGRLKSDILTAIEAGMSHNGSGEPAGAGNQ